MRLPRFDVGAGAPARLIRGFQSISIVRNMLRYLTVVLPVLGGAGLTGCGDATEQPETTEPAKPAVDWLNDVTAGVGISLQQKADPEGTFFMPRIMGSGGALFDFDNDGDLDVYLVTYGPNALFRQEADGTFAEVAAEVGVADNGYGMGAAIGDVDNDGDLDLFVSNFGANRLYRNDGNGGFSDITEAAGISDDAWSTSAAFFDFDRDGYLDLYVANYLEYDPQKRCVDQSGRAEFCGPQAFPGTADFLYRNNGGSSFVDVASEAGTSSTEGKGLGVVVADFDRDGWQDVLVANDGVNNQLWMNTGAGTFEEQGVAMGVAVNGFGKPEASMGIALGDADGDLRLDVYMTHLDRETNTLYTALGMDGFTDATPPSGLGPASLPWTGFGAAFGDLENDGDLDLLVVNGRVRRPRGVDAGAGGELAAYAEPNALSLNLGDGRFADGCESAGGFCSALEVGRGLMLGDVDRDGGLDVLITNCHGPARLYRNETPGAGQWLAIRAIDSRYSRDAIGSLIYVSVGGRWSVRPVTHAYSYLSSSDATAHFGLGEAARADKIVVRWADGLVEAFPGASGGQVLRVERGTGASAPEPTAGP